MQKIKSTPLGRVLNILCLVALGGATLYLLFSWNSIPNDIPGHYNALGEIDRVTGKGSLIFLMLFGWILYLGLSLIERFPSLWNTGVKITEENRERVYSALKNMLEVMKFLVVGNFCYLTISSAQGGALPSFYLPVFLILLIGSSVYYLLKLRRLR